MSAITNPRLKVKRQQLAQPVGFSAVGRETVAIPRGFAHA
jgi:hypothetical protein